MATHLAYAPSPIPDKVIPISVVFIDLVHDLSHQIIHSHAEYRKGAQLMGQGLLLVSRRATVLLYCGCVIHLVRTQRVSRKPMWFLSVNPLPL